jgi:hypothetical protein
MPESVRVVPGVTRGIRTRRRPAMEGCTLVPAPSARPDPQITGEPAGMASATNPTWITLAGRAIGLSAVHPCR